MSNDAKTVPKTPSFFSRKIFFFVKACFPRLAIANSRTGGAVNHRRLGPKTTPSASSQGNTALNSGSDLPPAQNVTTRLSAAGW